MLCLILSVVAAVIALVYLWFCFTFVAEGTAKIVVRFGAYRKTLLAKRGFRIDYAGNVVSSPRRSGFFGGLRWVGLLRPLGVDRIYKCTMKYVKALSDGTFERRADAGTDFILAGTQYQYGLEFADAEDKLKLPLHGRMTMTAMIVNPYRALFLVKDWFDALVGRVLPRVREYISEHEYDKIINDRDTQLDRDVFAMLNQAGPNGEPSIISILRDQYGIELIALETVNVDPPEGYRDATLAKWQAQQDADRDMEQTAGRLLKSVAKVSGLEPEELAAKLKSDPSLRGKPASEGGFKEAFADAVDQLKRDRAGDGLQDVRVGSADGRPLPSSLQYLSFGGGGGAGVLMNSRSQDSGNRGRGRSDRNRGNRDRGNRGGGRQDRNRDRDQDGQRGRVTTEEMEDELKRFEQEDEE